MCPIFFLSCKLLLASWFLELPWDLVQRNYSLHSKAAVLTCSGDPCTLQALRTVPAWGVLSSSSRWFLTLLLLPHPASLPAWWPGTCVLELVLPHQRTVRWDSAQSRQTCICIWDSQSAVGADCWKEQKGWMGSMPTLKYLHDNSFFFEKLERIAKFLGLAENRVHNSTIGDTS